MSSELEGAIAEAEGTRTISTPWGKQYPVAPKMGLMPLAKFAYLSKRGLDTGDAEALAVMYQLIHNAIADEAWTAFELDASEARADENDLMKVVQEAIAVMTARPTPQPGDSSAGLSTTGESSTGSSDFEARKRALGLVPVEQEFRAS